MNLLEIKNNLVKLSYSETETPVLGRFIVLAGANISYVAQLVNLKSDATNHFAIAKLLFTFTPDGVVDNYDGSMPNPNSEISLLPTEEILHLLPMETPMKFGNIAQTDNSIALDISVFERNLTVFVQKDIHKTTLVSNCVRQLFQMKEKSVVVDTCNMFDDYEKMKLGIDYKLPLNSNMIDYIFEYDLADVDPTTKAVIQDIFYAVQQYIDSLDFKFLPIDNFVDVVTNQYKELQMPELALLKNKLLKYRDANVFANTKDEVIALKEKLEEKNCVIIDLKDVTSSLQKEVLSIVHSTLESIDKYIYFFVPLNDENSDKKLLKQFINHNHIFTTFMVSSSYKYAQELKEHAQNIILFAPDNVNNDFAAYNTFLSKLNPDECVIYGRLTQGVPFIVDINNVETDLTQDDVFGDKYQFIPVVENTQMVKVDEYGNQTPVEFVSNEQNSVSDIVDETVEEEIISPNSETIPLDISSQIVETVAPEIETSTETIEQDDAFTQEMDIQPLEEIQIEQPSIESDILEPEQNIIAPVSNILDDESFMSEEEDLQVSPEPEISELPILDESENGQEELTEDDLDFIDSNQSSFSEDLDEIVEGEVIQAEGFEELPYDENPTVPVYPAEDNSNSSDSIDYNQGDTVTHPRYGRGVVEKIIKYGNKTLCSITFDNVGRRLLDPTISELTKL